MKKKNINKRRILIIDRKYEIEVKRFFEVEYYNNN